MNALPLAGDASGWLTNEDLLCVIDDVYTYDVIEEAEGRDPAAITVLYGARGALGVLEPGQLDCGSVAALCAAVAVGASLVAIMALLGWSGSLALLVDGGARLEAGAAPLLILGSALSAGLMSLTAGSLAARGLPTATVAATCGVVANLLFVALGAAEPHPPPRPRLHAIAAQAVLGGILPHLAFASIARSGLAVANCLMFTMPLWTAAFASALGSAPWGILDAALSVSSLLGVWLVARPAPSTPFSAAGVLAGLGFGACGGLLNVALGSEQLRGASPNAVSAWQMGAAVVFGVPSLLASDGLLLGAATACSPTLFVGMALVGVLMVATSWMRTTGLQKAASSTVATLLYTEIAWAFLFDVLCLGAHPSALQLAGTALIICGAIACALIQRVAPTPPQEAKVSSRQRDGLITDGEHVLNADEEEGRERER